MTGGVLRALVVDDESLARSLQSLARAPALIFVTAHAEHAVQAFDLKAVDYLTKPVRLERLQQPLQKVERYIESRRGLEAKLAVNYCSGPMKYEIQCLARIV